MCCIVKLLITSRMKWSRLQWTQNNQLCYIYLHDWHLKLELTSNPDQKDLLIDVLSDQTNYY